MIKLRRTVLVVAVLASVAAPLTATARQIHRSCVIPDVRGATLRAAEKQVRAANCSVGRVKGPQAALVSDESPTPGEHAKGGTKIALTLKRGPAKAVGTHGVPSAARPVGISGSWHLVLNSAFSGTTLPPEWRADWFGKSAPTATTELDCYSSNNVTFPGDGSVHLLVTAQPATCAGTREPYTAALISTNPNDGRSTPGFQYTYGVLEARIYLPSDHGKIADWPAFWANGQNWPVTGENDVLEGLSGCAFWSFHNAQALTHGCVRTMGPGWHTFASDWEPGSLTYYYDGVAVKTLTTGITSAPMYLVLDNEVHSKWASVTEPSAMKVQYVRVWQH